MKKKVKDLTSAERHQICQKQKACIDCPFYVNNPEQEVEIDEAKMTPLEAFYYLMDFYFDNEIVKEQHGITQETFRQKGEMIENALKEKEQQDNVLKVLKETIEFERMLPHIEPNKDNGFDIMSAVGINIQRDIENKERELLRQWVLKTCFPKELEALEIFKENAEIECLEDKLGYFVRITSKATEAHCTLHIKTKEHYDLLTEVLL